MEKKRAKTTKENIRSYLIQSPSLSNRYKKTKKGILTTKERKIEE